MVASTQSHKDQPIPEPLIWQGCLVILSPSNPTAAPTNMANLLTDIDQDLPVLEANSSQSPLLGEEEEGQDIGTCISRSKQTDVFTYEDSHQIMDENMAEDDTEDFHAPSQETSFWYRRRLEAYERPPQDDPSQDDAGAWSLFTRNTEASIAETALPYWDPLKLENLKQWQPELLALIISISSFAGIVGLLVKYNGRIQPDFADQISINALIAVFSTILRATLLFVISEGWYHRYYDYSPRLV